MCKLKSPAKVKSFENSEKNIIKAGDSLFLFDGGGL
jgi:hypothetical protein